MVYYLEKYFKEILRSSPDKTTFSPLFWATNMNSFDAKIDALSNPGDIGRDIIVFW